MAAGAAGAVAGTHTDQQAGPQQARPAALELDSRQHGKQPPEQRRQQQTEEEQPLLCPALAALQHRAEQAADAGDAPVAQHEQTGGQTDQRTAGEGTPGREIQPVDGDPVDGDPVDSHDAPPAQNNWYRVSITAKAAGLLIR
ncbi:hypothetical protein FQZ97_1132300 [compost metagenome]